MKHNRLCAIAHNFADSLASGLCFVIGYHPVDVFGEAASTEEGIIEVDFLQGQIVGGQASENLKLAVARFAEVLPKFCRDNGADVADFETLSAAFSAKMLDRQALITVKDRNGHLSITEYAGVPLKRPRVVDGLGRIRREPRRTVTAGG